MNLTLAYYITSAVLLLLPIGGFMAGWKCGVSYGYLKRKLEEEKGQ